MRYVRYRAGEQIRWGQLAGSTILVNGQVRQRERTGDFIFDVATQIAWISQIMPLEPGDLVQTGTPMTWGACPSVTASRSRSRRSENSRIPVFRDHEKQGLSSRNLSMATFPPPDPGQTARPAWHL